MDRLTKRSIFCSPDRSGGRPGETFSSAATIFGKVNDMRRFVTMLLALSMALSLTACGGSDTTETTENTETTQTEGTETNTDTSAIPGLEDGVFTVGMECAYAPYNWTQMDDSNGAVAISNVPGAYANGYDVMIAQKICDTYGWELEVVSSAWDSLTPAVQSGTMDANIAGQSMTCLLYTSRCV